MASLFRASHYPAGRELNPDDQSVPNYMTVLSADGPSPTSKFYLRADDEPPLYGDPVSSDNLNPQPTQMDYFIPSSAFNNPQPTTTRTPGTDTIVSTFNSPASGTVTLSTDTLQPTHTAVLAQGALSKDSSSKKKYIIGGAVGGGVLVLMLLVCLLCCCRKRRAKKDLERSGGGGGSKGTPAYGQFACCTHGVCNKNNGQPHMEQKSPLKPFVLKSASVASFPKGGHQQHAVLSKRRDSSESQGSAGSDTSTSYSSDSDGRPRGRRRSQKRPPPLKLTSLVTPVIHGPQDNPRNRVERPPPPNSNEVPTIVVEPPRSMSPR